MLHYTVHHKGTKDTYEAPLRSIKHLHGGASKAFDTKTHSSDKVITCNLLCNLCTTKWVAFPVFTVSPCAYCLAVPPCCRVQLDVDRSFINKY